MLAKPDHRYLLEQILQHAQGATVLPITLTAFGGACPMQAEGKTVDHRIWYFRLRGNQASLSITREGAAWNEVDLESEILEVIKGDAGLYLGELPVEAACKMIGELFATLIKPAPGRSHIERMQTGIEYLARVIQNQKL